MQYRTFIGMGSQRSTTGNAIASLTVAGNGEDRSDTWSVDAVASDSEADPVQRSDDLLMIDDTDGADAASGLQFFFFWLFCRIFKKFLCLAIFSISLNDEFFGQIAEITALNYIFGRWI